MTEQQDKACREAFDTEYSPHSAVCGVEYDEFAYIWRLALSTVAPPSVEALQDDYAKLQGTVSSLGIREMENLERIATLEATNAAQAEQLAELRSMNTVLLEQNGRMSQQLALLQSSSSAEQVTVTVSPEQLDRTRKAFGESVRSEIAGITPEPQAGVELTDEEITALAAEHCAWKSKDLTFGVHFYEESLLRFVSALNQRQAVKAEPASDGFRTTWHSDGYTCLNCGKGQSEHEDQLWCPAEPLSANGTPPEGWSIELRGDVIYLQTPESLLCLAVHNCYGVPVAEKTLHKLCRALLPAAPAVQPAVGEDLDIYNRIASNYHADKAPAPLTVGQLRAATVSFSKEEVLNFQRVITKLEEIESGVTLRSDESHLRDYRNATIKDAMSKAKFALKDALPLYFKTLEAMEGGSES